MRIGFGQAVAELYPAPTGTIIPMLRLTPAAFASLLLAASLAAQSLPKPRLPSSLPAAVPGADKLRSIPRTPGQVLREVRQESESELMAKALASNDPEEQVRLYTRILLINANNTVAFQGRKDALERIEKGEAETAQRQAEAAQREAETTQKVEESLNTERARRDSLKKAEEAFLAGNVEAAARLLGPGKKAAPNDPDIQNLDGLIQGELDSRERTRWLLIGGGGVLLAALVVVLLLRIRNRDPHLEVIAGDGKGKRYPMDKDLLAIGAVAQDGAGKNDVVVRDHERMVSRFHCEVHRRGRKLWLIDCESANGTWVDRRQAPPNKPVRLKSGSRIDLAGSTTLRVGFERRKK